MIIAFPVEYDKGLESRIAEDFGTADCFVWYNTDTKESGFADNTARRKNDGGRGAALIVKETGAEAVIVSGIGCAAVSRLRGLEITAYASQAGRVSGDAELFASGELKAMTAGGCDGSCR